MNHRSRIRLRLAACCDRRAAFSMAISTEAAFQCDITTAWCYSMKNHSNKSNQRKTWKYFHKSTFPRSWRKKGQKTKTQGDAVSGKNPWKLVSRVYTDVDLKLFSPIKHQKNGDVVPSPIASSTVAAPRLPGIGRLLQTFQQPREVDTSRLAGFQLLAQLPTVVVELKPTNITINLQSTNHKPGLICVVTFENIRAHTWSLFTLTVGEAKFFNHRLMGVFLWAKSPLLVRLSAKI